MAKNKKFQDPIFSEPQLVGKRDWGEESILEFSSGKWMMKKLFIKAGSKGGLQYHRLKDEGGILISGELIIRYADSEDNLVEKILLDASINK